MGVYIKGIDIPKESRLTLQLSAAGSVYVVNSCSITAETYTTDAIHVPPHGRLIDADALLESQRKFYCEDCERRKGLKNGKIRFLYEIGGVPCRACRLNDAMCETEDAPTVIEADADND